MNEDNIYIEFSPTEILIYIFKFLSPKQRAKCREVCWRWKRIVDNISNNEVLWLKHCKADFSSIYSIAYYKSMPGASWCSIYRSLTLWSKLDLAEETRDEFASAPRHLDEVRDFQVLRNGILGVHTRGAIQYYDLETLKPSRRSSISGNYMRYLENDGFIIVLAYGFDLFVVKKVINNMRYETDIVFERVKTALLCEQDLVYITLKDEVFLCELEKEDIKSVLLCKVNSSIMSISYVNKQLNLLTFEREIFKLVGKELVYQSTLDRSTNLLHELKKYDLLENLDWRVYFQWMYVLQHLIPQGPLRDMIILKTYGEAVFIGSNWGVLRIYYAPYKNNEFDIFNSEPVKQYNFMERWDCPVLSRCPIIQIDVVEGIDSHMLLVAMPKKIAILTYKYNFKATTSDAMLPYQEAQSIKIINSE